MRVREVTFHDFRSFRGQNRISFVDRLTGAVRPMTVIAGTNGTGKTTILDTIEAFFRELALKKVDWSIGGLQNDTFESAGKVSVTFEIDPEKFIGDTGNNSRRQLVLERVERQQQIMFQGAQLWGAIKPNIQEMEESSREMYGGLIYFPDDRDLKSIKGGAIEPGKTKKQWVYRLSATDQWQGSLEQFWVWQNYLDLEQNREREHLGSFVETVEDILGEDRRIVIREGRAMVPASWPENGEVPLVRLDQLPSGEQQVLLLFGELARHLRPGAVIMIDEPEASLHPSLQRLVVHELQQIADEWDAQIIIATHSLEILHAVHDSEVIFLDDLIASSPADEEEAILVA